MSNKLYDFTALDCLARCEAEHGYRYQQHLARAEPDASAFFGQVVHVGVRNLFAGTHEPDGLAQAWGDFVAPPKKAHLTLRYAQEIVEMYAEQYGFARDGQECAGAQTLARPQVPDNIKGQVAQPSICPDVLRDVGPSLLAVASGSAGTLGLLAPRAASFDLVLNEHYLEHPERSLCGIVDRVVRSKADGQLYVMDLKTTGLYLSQAWFEQWRHSLQAVIYMDLVEHHYAPFGHSDAAHVAGFWVDAIHVNRRGYPKPEDFMRVGPFAYSRELRSELRDVVDALVQRAKELEEWPGGALKNPRSCWRYNALCAFFQFCTLNVQDRADAVKMALLAGDFVSKPWEPANR